MSVTWSATELAAVNGVIIPTKLSAGQQPIKGPPCTTRQIGKALPCSRCGTTFPRLYQVRAPFHRMHSKERKSWRTVLGWEDPRETNTRVGQIAILQLILTWHSPRTVTPAVTSTVVETAKRARLDKRNGKIAANTTSFNGIIMPSKVLPGLPPNQGNFFEQRQGIFVGNCTICGRGFMKKHQIQYHFSACTKRNGNPFGRSWTDPFEPWTTKDDGSAKLLRWELHNEMFAGT